MQAISQYEVRCPRCDVTFPPETKVCMHCGARTGPSIIELPDHPEEYGGSEDSNVRIRTLGDDADGPFEYPLEAEDESEGRSPNLMRSVSTLIWVALAILFTLMRACSDN